jgi:hypothetical protein
MSAAAPTRIFGMRLGIDPRLLVGGLIALAVVLFWYNSRSDEHPGTAANTAASTAGSAGRTGVVAPVIPMQSRTRTPRRGTISANERGVLRLKPVDARDGRVDPTLRLYLLARLQSIKGAAGGRSLFETGPSPEQVVAMQRPITGPKIPINAPLASAKPVAPSGPVMPVANIPLKFYGFVNPASKAETNRGLFLQGDNILVAAEGDVLDHRYLVVELSANSARMEDIQIKQGQTLPVVPEFVQP